MLFEESDLLKELPEQFFACLLYTSLMFNVHQMDKLFILLRLKVNLLSELTTNLKLTTHVVTVL